jgi:hypothetical protein
MKNAVAVGAMLIGLGTLFACTSNSSSGSGNGSGSETYSCTIASQSLCTQLLVPTSGSTLATEQQQCTNDEQGTNGTGCASAGLVGCCKPLATDPSKEEQCFYSASAASIGQTTCSLGNKTWSTTGP